MATEPAGARRRHALIVEDDGAIRELVRLHLSLAGLETTELGDGAQALATGRATPFDIIVLDVMLPGLDGITVCRALRADGANTNTPILMVTARDMESDKVVGLESGADDYLTKPFGVRELVARVSALIRRSERAGAVGQSPATPAAQSHGVTVDVDRREVIVRGEPVELTKQEFDVLHVLVTHPGIVFSRAALLSRVWGGDTYVTERTVDSVVSRLRRKIEHDPQDPELILTAWGVGYKFVDAE